MCRFLQPQGAVPVYYLVIIISANQQARVWHLPKALQAVPFFKFEQPCCVVNARQQLVAWPVAPLSRPTGIAPCHALQKQVHCDTQHAN